MKQHFAKKAFIGIFILFLCMPWFLWFFVEKFVDSENYENRTLASKPLLTLDTYANFPEEYEAYYNDNLPFRNILISLNSRINYYLLHTSVNKDVIIGKKGWLFYKKTTDGDPIACYQGTNLYSEDKLKELAANLLKIQNQLTENGIEFVVFIAPNKERIYSEMMPDYYGEPTEEYRALQVVNYLKEKTDIRVVFPYAELLETKGNLKDAIIYHKADTHWNYIGGYTGARALLEELKIEIPDITSDKITITPTDNKEADLANMLNLKSDLINKEDDYIITGYDTHGAKNINWDFKSTFVYQSNNADPRKLYVIRDSFCSAMSEYLGTQFNDSYMIHSNNYTYEDFLAQNPDIFVLETVERYVDKLRTFKLNSE